MESPYETIIIDISKWQGEMVEDVTLAAKPDGIILKAGGLYYNSGVEYTDGQFESNYKKFNNKIPLGAYYFFYPHFSGESQAIHFLEIIKGKSFHLPIFLDFESNIKKVDAYKVRREVVYFLEYLYANYSGEIGIYTRGMFWNYYFGHSTYGSQFKLWIARYSEDPDYPLTHPWNSDLTTKPESWHDWWAWQYSDSNTNGKLYGATGSTAIDMNYVNMSKKEYYKSINWPYSEDKDEPPTDDVSDETDSNDIECPECPECPEIDAQEPTRDYVTLKDGFTRLRIRSTPKTGIWNIVGFMNSGEKVELLTTFKDGENLWACVLRDDNKVGWAAILHNGTEFLDLALEV